MKKLFVKDKNLRNLVLLNETKFFILKSIFKNYNFFILIRWNAFIRLNNFFSKINKFKIINKCLYTINKKRFNKFTNFSRHIYLKYIRSGQIHGMKKSSW